MPDVNQLHPWPDFLIVGTARSGTTALHEHLGKHPGIFVPLQKEPCYFTFAGEDPPSKIPVTATPLQTRLPAIGCRL